MNTVLRILKAVGGWSHGLHVRVENPPYMALVIEATNDSGPCSLPALSVCHYGEQNGDDMRDPEMLFELGFVGNAHLNPYYCATIMSPSSSGAASFVMVTTATRSSICSTSASPSWDMNLRQQGFLEAFERQRQPHV